MSEEKKTAVTEEVKEARELTNEELEQVTGGVQYCQMFDKSDKLKVI